MPHEKLGVVHSFSSLKKRNGEKTIPIKVYVIAKGHFNWKRMDFVITHQIFVLLYNATLSGTLNSTYNFRYPPVPQQGPSAHSWLKFRLFQNKR